MQADANKAKSGVSPALPKAGFSPITSAGFSPVSRAGFFLSALLILALFPPFVSAQAPSDFTWANYGEQQVAIAQAHFQAPTAANSNVAGDWFRLAMLAILICLFANAIVFVFAKAMHSTTAERFAVSEFYQVSASAIMILVVVTMLTQAFAFLQYSGIMPLGTTTTCLGRSGLDVWQLGPPAVIQCHLQEKITYTEGLMYQAKELNKNVESLTTLCLYVMSVQAYCGDWDSALHKQMESAHLLANKIVLIGVGLHAQYSFIAYLARNMLSVFLPLGLLLRIFPGIRGIGGLLIAMSIGFFFVFPIAYMLLDPATSRPNPSDLLPSATLAPAQCFSTFSGAVSMITQLASTKQQTVATPDASELGQELAKLQTEAFIIPLAALAITLLFIQTAATILGGDAGEIMHFIARVI
ncbi:MAG: hypothetical protein M1530_02945 [Candidatus Marsarchaeota archaeon]|nr:hypothetical protein [Candidatus Marsarchaeota archaeon]